MNVLDFVLLVAVLKTAPGSVGQRVALFALGAYVLVGDVLKIVAKVRMHRAMLKSQEKLAALRSDRVAKARNA